MEKRRTSTRLREPPAKRRDTGGVTAQSEQPVSSPRAIGRPKGPYKRHKGWVVIPFDEPPPPPPPEEKPEDKTIVVLPSKVVDGQPLPSLPERQSKRLTDTEWQDIGNSGVLVASLARSRQRWLHEGMFETYWSKSTYKKKKEQQAASKGEQVKESRPNMTKIGTCKMVVEPHIFDVTMFVIKDATAPPVAAPLANRPTPNYGGIHHQGPHMGHHHHMPYQGTGFNNAPPSKPIYPAPSNGSAKPAGSPSIAISGPASKPPAVKTNYSQAASSQMTPPSSSKSNSVPETVMPNTIPGSNQAPSKYGSQPGPVPVQNDKVPTASTQMSGVQQVNASQPTINAPLASSAPKPNQPPKNLPPPPPGSQPDPVIQMLAHRAQNDQALKQVMKLVASGQASQTQLNYFQGHIDELTKIVKQQHEDERKRKTQIAGSQQHTTQNLQKQQTQQYQAQKQHGPKYNQAIQPTASSKPYSMSQNMHNMNGSATKVPTTMYQQSPQQSRPLFQGPTGSVQPRPPRHVQMPPPLHVLLEFSQNSADRFLFPKNSILEFENMGTTLLASFLVVKTTSQLEASSTADAKRAKKEAKSKAKAEGEAPPAPEAKKDPAPASKIEAGDSSTINEEKQYYQPVTVRFEHPSDGSIFNALSRVVAPIEQVQKHMLEVASKAEFVPNSFLAMRLPREEKEIVLSPTIDETPSVS